MTPPTCCNDDMRVDPLTGAWVCLWCDRVVEVECELVAKEMVNERS